MRSSVFTFSVSNTEKQTRTRQRPDQMCVTQILCKQSHCACTKVLSFFRLLAARHAWPLEPWKRKKSKSKWNFWKAKRERPLKNICSGFLRAVEIANCSHTIIGLNCFGMEWCNGWQENLTQFTSKQPHQMFHVTALLVLVFSFLSLARFVRGPFVGRVLGRRNQQQHVETCFRAAETVECSYD